MTNPEITLVSTSYKDFTLTYREGDRVFHYEVELSGVKQYHFVGLDTQFQSWNTPAVPMSREDAARVRANLEQWGRERGTPIGIGPPIDLVAQDESLRSQGFTIEQGVDAEGRPITTYSMSPEERAKRRAAEGFLGRLKRKWRRF